MKTAQLDAFMARIQRVGGASGLPKNMTQEQLIDELQRQLGALGDVCRALLTELRAGPIFPKDGKLFLVDARSGSSNILSVAQATAEGLGAVAGLSVYRHGLGYKLDRAVQTYSACTPTKGVVNGQDTENGTCMLYSYDDQRTIFQIDKDAADNQALFIFSLYSSFPVPSATVNPNQADKTGASSRQLGTIRASTATGLP